MNPVSGVTPSAGQIQSQYLNLLITQLQNQNPLDPMDNNQMTTQLSQLSQLQQLETLGTTFKSVFQSVQMSQASGLLGKTISFIPSGQSAAISGKVEGVVYQNSQPCLRVGSNTVTMDQIQGIN